MQKNGAAQPGGEAEDPNAGGADDGPENVEAETPDPDVPVEADGSDPDGGAEGGGPGADSKGNPDEVAPEEGLEEPAAPTLDAEAIVAQVLAKLGPQGGAQPAAQPQETIRERSPEEWAQLEQRTGMPKSAIEFVTKQSLQVINTVREEIRGMFAKEMSGFKKDGAFREMAAKPDFRDIARFRPAIEKALQNYAVEHHANPQLIEQLYWAERGRMSKADVKRASLSKEGNRKISGPARPASPGGGKSGAPIRLSPQQRSAARAFGMSDSEYAKMKAGK